MILLAFLWPLVSVGLLVWLFSTVSQIRRDVAVIRQKLEGDTADTRPASTIREYVDKLDKGIRGSIG